VTSGTPTLAGLVAIDANTTGVVTAVITDTAANLNTLTGTNNAITMTVCAGSIAATVLSSLDSKTSVAVDARLVSTITGTAAGITQAANYAATVSGALVTADLANLIAIDNDTSGVVTATITDTAANLNTLTGNKNAITMHVSDRSVAASVLSSLDSKTSVAVDAGLVTTITGKAAEIAAVNGAAGITQAAGYNATVSGSVNNSQLVSIDADTTGIVTATITAATAYLGTLSGTNNVIIINGTAANNLLTGSNGNDTLIGGTGTDKLTGGAGNDLFKSAAYTDLGINATRDLITDFVVGKDKIDLSSLDAISKIAGNQAFQFVNDSFTRAGQVSYNQSNGIVSINTDADKAAEYQIELTGTHSVLHAMYYLTCMLSY
jgi:Ca2+-binding RTX toxin-like protein